MTVTAQPLMHINAAGERKPDGRPHNSPGTRAMCLGIPMQVLESDGILARCAGRGEERTVNLLLVGEVPVGGWVMVHLDNAVRELEEEDLAPLNDALDAILLAAQGGNTYHLFADILAARELEA